LNDIGRNSLLGKRKKIAKFLMRTFTYRSTFLYGHKGRKKDRLIENGMRKLDKCREVQGRGQKSYTIVSFWSMDQISIKTPNPKCRLFEKI
jgi:hypothetical protein